MLQVISLGAGVQSTTLLLMAEKEEILPRPDCAIFGDTQGEPEAVYRHLDWLRSGVTSIPIYVVSAGNLWDSATRVRRTKDGERTYIATGIPVFTVDGLSRGIGRRQCTRTFKIEPVNKKIKELLGRKRIPANSAPLVEVWMGISTDEATRMKPSPHTWIATRWPLIEKNMSRQDCLAWMKKHNYPEPPKSACTFCPYHSDAAWLSLTDAEFSDAVEKEKELQAAYAKASAIRGIPYLHSSRVPLGAVVFKNTAQTDLFSNECESWACGV